MTSLKELYISSNRIKHIESISTSLRILHLSDNKIHTITNLEELVDLE